ncbi:TrlF family AAA-like ATPase [Mycobacteroides abscessus]|uniref:TrlF family AAA-like ATPase n=1 Tax=Mycobacteroides abscessus TaxID=36809 RepID=UPI0012FFF15D|nr:AAA family ATPase [Mycobacteroides abscessus]
MNDLSQGSVWRRWDPHVHLPGTLLNNQFGSTTIESALDTLASREPKIEVLGVTDYYTTASFRKAQEAWRNGSGSGISYLFPNVELRLDVPTTKGSGINLHVMSAPEDVDKLDEMLSRLTFTYDDHQHHAGRDGLIALGRAFKQNPSLEEDAALREGANQFKVNFKEIRELFMKDSWYREHCLVGVAGNKNDGTSGLQTEDGAFAAQRRSIERFSQIIFSSSDQQRAFWLGQGADSPETITQTYGALKLCLHGSDAHEAAKLGRPDQDRFMWLKGDARFDTLRLACLAPETRAEISPNHPAAGVEQGRISAVEISDKTWFTPGTVPINTGLVAIIGARGSGKTALGDLIAVGAGSTQPFTNSASFVSRAGPLLRTARSTVEWHDGEPTSHNFLDADDDDGDDRRIRYLSQQFVEQLCASDGVSDELISEIERVIFNTWPIDERQGATNFQDLLEIRLAALKTQQATELQAIGDLSDEITHQRVLKSSLARKQEERKNLTTSIGTLTGKIKGLTSKTDSKNGERHGVISTALAKRQEQLQSVDRRITEIKALHQSVSSAEATQFPQFLRNFQTKHAAAGLVADEWKSFRPKFTGNVEEILSTALSKATAERSKVAGPVVDPETAQPLDGTKLEDLLKRTVSELKVEQTRLEKLVGLDQERTKQLTRLQGQLNEAQARGAKLDTEIKEAEDASAREVELINERTDRYEAYFNALLGQEGELKELYAPLHEMIKGFGKSVKKLQLSVRRRVDIRDWVRQGEQLIDLRTAGDFKGAGEMERLVETALRQAWETGDGAAAAAAIQQFSSDHSASLRKQARVPRDDEKAYREWEQNVARWLYSVEHIDITYSLEYEGLNVERLSPGTRGIVLLLLYLAIDQAETDPLIIDQPEENLDPESVFTELVSLFRSASTRRQIIMITHNANLVVNTDVDQVIVAHCDSLEEGKLPRLRYVAGGLEDSTIRRAVCDVLEGGEEAFRQRARRLHVNAPRGAVTA